ncbi:ABC transporter ATP-binding protein [Macrococcoides canis]|uniref:ABC transporter ATP-binding protein n=1 Tax=Macrococcoides canis TaxID=1855823 RepID=A0A4R6C7G5_9STAP|nr:ABC transporter ATP-binding protein [Macrococcus canis]MEE1108329.1 ABC transporter ATP-binding protein [Macrococcus canis]TDM18466.1 ABC transporter ATP-binding protein [Macrococcus canis]TDM21487.1 ABC transporter ATP-binding protein [Macrococcus canis]TDM23638.1 ABC transporter ATP-binding protein [Macrococcus canis]TDM31625.1 ABC transporter ATP-binding protein [Macrococcus canis]
MEHQQYSLEVSNLHKKIGKREIIKDLNFTVNQGEVFGFLGPNGAGKTTTIRMIVGLTTPTEGDIKVFGKSVVHNRSEVMKDIGAIVENPELYPFLSGYENLMQFARMQKGITKSDIDRVVKLVGLETRIKDKVKKYSLGMRQRLGLAQALLHKPKLLILDEPTNGLDPAGIREIRDYIKKLAKEENMSVIVSSHLMSEMELMCDRFGIIKNGRMVQIEAVNQTVTADTVVKHKLDLYPAERAVAFFQSIGKQYRQDDDIFTIEAASNDIPELVRNIVKYDIDIYSVTKEKESLEDRFMNITNDGGAHIG